MNDWKLRTEMLPKITKTNDLLFEKQEKLAKILTEIEILRKENEKTLGGDEELQGKIDELQTEFDEISGEIDAIEAELKEIRDQIKITAPMIKCTKEDHQKIVTDLYENQAIYERMKETYKDSLKTQLKQTCDATTSTMHADDCVITGLRQAICQTSRDIREAKIQISKLNTDVNFLMDKGMREVIGQDYLGSNFVKYI